MQKPDVSQMDFKKIVDIKELKKTMSRLEYMAAAAMIVFFLFPVVSLGPFSVNGFNAATLGGSSFFLFLIPLFSLLIIAMRPICQVEQILKIMKLITGALPIVFILYGFIEVGGDIFRFLAFGSYLMLIAGIVIILATLGIIKLPNSEEEACEAVPAVEKEEQQ